MSAFCYERIMFIKTNIISKFGYTEKKFTKKENPAYNYKKQLDKKNHTPTP